MQQQTVPWGHGCPLLMRVTEDSWSVVVRYQELEQQKPQRVFPLQTTAVLCVCPCSISVGVPHQPSCWTPRFSQLCCAHRHSLMGLLGVGGGSLPESSCGILSELMRGPAKGRSRSFSLGGLDPILCSCIQLTCAEGQLRARHRVGAFTYLALLRPPFNLGGC